MSEKYVPPEVQQSDKEDTRVSLRARLDIIDQLRKHGEVLKSNEQEPAPGTKGDDSRQTNPAANDDASQNNQQSDATTQSTQSDNQQKRVDLEQLERERLQKLEQIRAEIAQEYAKGNRHAPFRPEQS